METMEAPAGWYLAPDGSGQQWWWTGTHWVSPVVPPPAGGRLTALLIAGAVVAVIVALIVSGPLTRGSEPAGPKDTSFSAQVARGEGNPAVYDRIAAETSCVELQAMFDRNMADRARREPGDELRKIVLSYATAANDRMRVLGC